MNGKVPLAGLLTVSPLLLRTSLQKLSRGAGIVARFAQASFALLSALMSSAAESLAAAQALAAAPDGQAIASEEAADNTVANPGSRRATDAEWRTQNAMLESWIRNDPVSPAARVALADQAFANEPGYFYFALAQALGRGARPVNLVPRVAIAIRRPDAAIWACWPATCELAHIFPRKERAESGVCHIAERNM